jgi:hypothetical protein
MQLEMSSTNVQNLDTKYLVLMHKNCESVVITIVNIKHFQTLKICLN